MSFLPSSKTGREEVESGSGLDAGEDVPDYLAKGHLYRRSDPAGINVQVPSPQEPEANYLASLAIPANTRPLQIPALLESTQEREGHMGSTSALERSLYLPSPEQWHWTSQADLPVPCLQEVIPKVSSEDQGPTSP